MNQETKQSNLQVSNSNKEVEPEFGLEDERFYFKNEVKESSSMNYIIVVILGSILMFILQINWGNLNQYNSIKSEEKYPVAQIAKDQLFYYGQNYDKYKIENGVNKFLLPVEIKKYWSNCIGTCEIPGTDRFNLISSNQNFINWACNERVKAEHYSATKYATWKLNNEGCILTNFKEVKQKDREEIRRLKWKKQKEMEIYLALALIIFLAILHTVKKIIKTKRK